MSISFHPFGQATSTKETKKKKERRVVYVTSQLKQEKRSG